MNLSAAWETTIEDVETVLRAHGQLTNQDDTEQQFWDLDRIAVAKAALYGNDMENQTNYAYQEIEKQLRLTPTKFS